MIDEPIEPPDPADALVRADGSVFRASRGNCPRCGAPPSKRVASSGFGAPHPICSRCGYEFTGDLWVQP